MTREENLHWLDVEIQHWEDDCQSKHPIKEALYAARKALEQEPKPMIEIDLYSVIKQKYIEREVLNKIRAEIEQTSETVDGFLIHDATRRTVLRIIDKYKTESEGKK